MKNLKQIAIATLVMWLCTACVPNNGGNTNQNLVNKIKKAESIIVEDNANGRTTLDSNATERFEYDYYANGKIKEMRYFTMGSDGLYLLWNDKYTYSTNQVIVKRNGETHRTVTFDPNNNYILMDNLVGSLSKSYTYKTDGHIESGTFIYANIPVGAMSNIVYDSNHNITSLHIQIGGSQSELIATYDNTTAFPEEVSNNIFDLAISSGNENTYLSSTRLMGLSNGKLGYGLVNYFDLGGGSTSNYEYTFDSIGRVNNRTNTVYGTNIFGEIFTTTNSISFSY